MLVEYMCHSGDDLLVVNAARCSFGKEKQEFTDADAKLISYLAREKHVLPFRHPTITLRCKAPIFVARQLMKHQAGMSWSEESRRYITSEPEFYWPEIWREKADNVKQGSSDNKSWFMHEETDYDNSYDHDVKEAASVLTQLYNKMLEGGVAPEQARMILPQNMYSTWVWTGTLLAWIHMLQLRLDSHTQAETREFAGMVKDIIQPLYPVSYKALMQGVE